MRVIGVTGGIGSGKSTVARILTELGAEMIDADKVGHEVYRPGTVGWDRLVEAFGRDIVAPDGSIDRKRLGAIVFADSAALARINAIVHPLIAGEVERRIAARRAAGSPTPIVLEAAVLLEANWDSLVDEIWVVAAPREAVVERVRTERGLPAEQIEARIAAQLSDDQRRRRATLVIENNASIELLRRRVGEAWERVTR